MRSERRPMKAVTPFSLGEGYVECLIRAIERRAHISHTWTNTLEWNDPQEAEYIKACREAENCEHILLMYIRELEAEVNDTENQPSNNIEWSFHEDLGRWMGPHGTYLRYDIAGAEWVLWNWLGYKLANLETRSVREAKTRAALYLQDKLPTD